MFTVQGQCFYIAGKDIGRDCSYDIEVNAEKFRDMLNKTKKNFDNPFEDNSSAVVNHLTTKTKQPATTPKKTLKKKTAVAFAGLCEFGVDKTNSVINRLSYMSAKKKANQVVLIEDSDENGGTVSKK